MRFIKLGIYSVVILFVVITLVGLLFPSTVVVSRATDITAPKDSILALTNNINNWKQWVEGMNNQAVTISSSTEADLAGTKVVINTVSDSMIVSTWTGKKGTVQQSTMRIIQHADNPKAVVQWQFMQQLKWYPWERISSMMNDKIMGEQLERNLANLKKVCEKR